MMMLPGLRAGCIVSTVGGRGRPGASRGGAIPPSMPSSSGIPILFHIRTAAICLRIDNNSTLYYKIAVGGIGNSTWDVFRRFSDFQLLQENINSLISSFEIQVSFPRRHWFTFLIALTDTEEKERQEGLQQWLFAAMDIAVGDHRPKGATTVDVNRIKECLNEFFEMKENFATALKNTEEEITDENEDGTHAVSSNDNTAI
jgi:hypothetical protein